MRINLYDIMAVVGQELTCDAELESVKGCMQGEEFLVKGTKAFQVNIKHTQKDLIKVVFDISVVVQRNCSRCLEPVSQEYDLHIERDVDVAGRKGMDSSYDESLSESDEISYIEDCNLDIDMLVLDELYTILPMTVLCKEECKGICKVCGINLNKSTCNCDQTVPDPRMAVFSDIFNEFKEV